MKHTEFRNQDKQKEALTPFALGAGRKWVEAQYKWTAAGTAVDKGEQPLLLFIFFFMSEVVLYLRTETHHSQSRLGHHTWHMMIHKLYVATDFPREVGY